LFAARADAEQSVVETLEVDDARERTDVRRARRAARLAPFRDERDAEARVLAHAAADHVDVARLEDPQPQRSVGKQDGAEREQRDGLGHGAACATRAS
jgi:hypothetical protein